MTKKSFTDDLKQYNPAQAFMTPAQEAPTSTSAMGVKLQEQLDEIKKQKAKIEKIAKDLETRRLQLVMTEALYNDIVDLARYDGKKVAQFIKDTLRNEINTRKDNIEAIRSL